MRKTIGWLLGISLMIPAMTQARPVSYPGGWTSMLMNDGDKNTAHVHYSPSARYSVGYRFEHWRERGFNMHSAQVNYLVRRWNRPESQANIYLKSGLGVAVARGSSQPDDKAFGGFVGVAMDWEDRRYFVSYENHYHRAGNIDDFFEQSARVGWAPYEGDYGDLHTWLMLQVEHSPESEDNFTITPLVRFFKGVHLVEAGVNNHGKLLFNYIIRY